MYFSILFSDPKQFRCTVLWLEDQKIRQYKIEDRAELRKVDSPQEWNAAYEIYKNEIGSPGTLKTPTEEIFWLLNHAIRLEYYDHADKFKTYTSEQLLKERKPAAPSVKSTNPFDKFDCTFLFSIYISIFLYFVCIFQLTVTIFKMVCVIWQKNWV